MCRLGQWFGPSSTVSGLNVCSVTLFPYIGLHLIPLGYMGAQKVERPEPNSEPLNMCLGSMVSMLKAYSAMWEKTSRDVVDILNSDPSLPSYSTPEVHGRALPWKRPQKLRS